MHPWAVTAAAGTHVCLDRVDPGEILRSLVEYGVTHLACAPVVLYMLINHPDFAKLERTRTIKVATGGAAPTAHLIASLERAGFELIHLYGLTECYGPTTLCATPDELADASAEIKAERLARQGLPHPTANEIKVVAADGNEVPWDGATIGEIHLSGNTLMAGYYRDDAATEKAFAGGWFHTGDLAVRHANGQVEIRDRAKDIIISGGENIASLEIEAVLQTHPAVLFAAVVPMKHEKWGEVPCAFIELKAGADPVAEDVLRLFCRERLAHFKVPQRFIYASIPKTASGKMQKYLLRTRVP
jgi:fatty-acyl-CoA synthase